jgi:hypothetical protein
MIPRFFLHFGAALRFAPPLKPAADQQVQPPNDGQDAYYREHCDYPEKHS